jgi:hypothetical protein
MYSVSEKTCLGSSDAMIVNVLLSSTFPFLVSTDYDAAYAVLASDDDDKTVFVPKNLFQRHIKGLIPKFK